MITLLASLVTSSRLPLALSYRVTWWSPAWSSKTKAVSKPLGSAFSAFSTGLAVEVVGVSATGKIVLSELTRHLCPECDQLKFQGFVVEYLFSTHH